MKNIICILALILIIWSTCGTSRAGSYRIDPFTGEHPIRSEIDNRIYKVIESYGKGPNAVVGGMPKDAADTLAKMNIFLQGVVEYMKNKYIIRKEGSTNDQVFVKRMVRRYNPDVVVENNPEGVENTSFVVNKGDTIAFCLREATFGTDQIHQIKILKFVALHELAHIGSKPYGHDATFWSDFKFILQNAAESGLYNPIDYNQFPDRYCGIDITYNPLFDEAL